ncbi:hypothetical protein DFJ74DRAFT_142515 [Hyaloraphidium curvatum]|nr:hypothetical protein DFJ74DRAFT_142515 [Hyaloraphidium curvatum]
MARHRSLTTRTGRGGRALPGRRCGPETAFTAGPTHASSRSRRPQRIPAPPGARPFFSCSLVLQGHAQGRPLFRARRRGRVFDAGVQRRALRDPAAGRRNVRGLFHVSVSFLIVMPSALTRTWKAFAPVRGKPGGDPAPEPDYSAHALAGLVRWSQLVELDSRSVTGRGEAENGSATGGASRLLEHRTGDPLCPCPLTSCAGRLVRSAPLLCLVEALARTLPPTGFILFVLATPMMVRAVPFWTSWWALPGVLAVVGALDYIPINTIGRFSTNASLLRLSLRVQRRAMFLSLNDMLDAFDRVIFSEHPAGDIPDAQLYAKLHYRLAEIWERRVPIVSGRIMLGFASAAFAVPLVADLAAGSCIPVFVVLSFVYLINVSTTDLTHVALSNEQIELITELYRQAQTAIRDMLVRAAPLPPDPDRAHLLDALAKHDRLLASFREVSGFRGRFLGFVVDFGVLRTFLVTVFTLLVGLWSILRGSVFFTLDSICPTR